MTENAFNYLLHPFLIFKFHDKFHNKTPLLHSKLTYPLKSVITLASPKPQNWCECKGQCAHTSIPLLVFLPQCLLLNH